jgi:hypothetical protein
MTLLQLTHTQYIQLQQIQQKCTKPQIFTSLHLTSLHFTSLHSTPLRALQSTYFTPLYFLMLSTPLSLSLIYHFPNPFFKTARFAGESP